MNMRGNSIRFHINNGSDTEMSPRPNSTEYALYSSYPDNGGHIDFTVTLSGNDVIFDICVCKNSGDSKTFTYTYENGRIADEIADADAKITVKIDPTQVSEAILAP